MAGLEEQARVAQAPVQGGTLSGLVTPEYYGAKLAGTTEDLGLALYTHAKQEADHTAVTMATRQLSEAQLTLHTDIRKMQGRDAVERAPEYLKKEWAKINEQVMKGAGNEIQRRAIEEQSYKGFHQLDAMTQEHVFQQSEVLADGETKGAIQASGALARQAAGEGNIEQVFAHQHDQDIELTKQASRKGLIGTETLTAARAAMRSGSNAEVITGLLSNNRDELAAEFYTKSRDEYLPADRDHVEKMLEEGTLRGQSMRKTEAYIAQGLSLKQGLTAIRADVKDPKLQDATVTRWKQYHSDLEAADKLQQEKRYELAHQMMDEQIRGVVPGTTVNPRDVIPPNEWVKLSPQAQSSLVTLGEHKAPESNRPNSDRKQLEFLFLSPEAKAGLSKLQYDTQYRSKFDNATQGWADGQLMSARAAVAEAKQKGLPINETTTFHQQVTGAFKTSGLVDPSQEVTKYGDKDARAFLEFEKEAGARVVAESAKQKRKLTATEERVVIDQAKDDLAREYLVPGTLWGTTTKQRAYLTPEEEKVATVPIAGVPEAWLQVLRDHLPRYHRLTSEQLRLAYAKQKLGRIDEARAILKAGQ